MYRRRAFRFLSFALIVQTLWAPVGASEPGSGYYHAPAWEEYIRIDPNGVTIMPNGRFLTPKGRIVWMPRNAYFTRFHPKTGAVWGCSSNGHLVITQFAAGSPERRFEHKGAGCALSFSSDGRRFYRAGGDDGSVVAGLCASPETFDKWNLNGTLGGRSFTGSYVADLTTSKDGRFLYVADIGNFRVVVFDTALGRAVGSVPAGRYPYALALSDNGKKLFVANIGVFEYSPIDAPKDPTKHDPRGLTRPAFGYPSPQARNGVEFEGRFVKGLGDPNVPDSFSVWAFDLSNPSRPRAGSKIKTGVLVNYPYENGRTVSGSAPNSIAIKGSMLYVSNGNNDTVDFININTGKIVRTVRIRPTPELSRYRGVTPYGLTVSPDGKRLYVCEAGINAMAVIDTSTGRILGHIPACWYPNSVAVSADGKRLSIANAKGLGQGPNGGKYTPRKEQEFGSLPGCLLLTDVPTDSSLSALTRRTLANNGLLPDSKRRAALPPTPISPDHGKPSKLIKHVVFITKENHTFDAVLGDLEGAVRDQSLAWWGKNRKIGPHENVHTMPNHLKLAQEFACSDNFYMEPEASGDGHRWLVGAYPNVWCQRVFETGWGFSARSSAPGRRVPFGSNGSIAPEDYLESGCLWEHLDRGRISFRNYGEGFEFAGVLEDSGEKPTGARETVNFPMPKPLFDNTCFEYPIFNMNIPDQYRADQFIKDLETNYPPGKKPLPRFLNAAICNDHGAGPRPDSGYPYTASFLADNDLALGRMVEYLSNRPEWRNMAIFVTQDDSGGDPDHIDRHRSICLAISPYAKRGSVSRRHTSISSILKTIYLAFGLPPCNLYDAVATDLTDMFTVTPDFRPYRRVDVDVRIFDPEKARDPADPDYKKAAARDRTRLDDPEQMRRVRPDVDEDD